MALPLCVATVLFQCQYIDSNTKHSMSFCFVNNYVGDGCNHCELIDGDYIHYGIITINIKR